MARSPSGIKRRREQDRERKRRKYDSDPEFKKRELERRKAHYAKNVASETLRSKRNYDKNRDERLEKRREWSRKNPERQRASQYAAYVNRPSTIISRTSQELRSGRIGVSEAYRRIGEALTRENAIDRKRGRSRDVCESDWETVETETRDKGRNT